MAPRRATGSTKSHSSHGSTINTDSNAAFMNMIQHLQDEVSALKEERPRKKSEKPDEPMTTSQQSFELLPQ